MSAKYNYSDIFIGTAKATTCLATIYFMPFSSLAGAAMAAGNFLQGYSYKNKTINLADNSSIKSDNIIQSIYDKTDSELSIIRPKSYKKVCQELYEVAKSYYDKKGALTFSFDDEEIAPFEPQPSISTSSQKNNFITPQYNLSTTVDNITIHQSFIESALAFSGSVDGAIELLKPLILSKVGELVQDEPFVSNINNAANFFLIGSFASSLTFIAAPLFYLINNELLGHYSNRQAEKNADEFMLQTSNDIDYISALKFLNLSKQMSEPKKVVSIEKTVPSYYDAAFLSSNDELSRIQHLDTIKGVKTSEERLAFDDLIHNYNELIAANIISFNSAD